GRLRSLAGRVQYRASPSRLSQHGPTPDRDCPAIPGKCSPRRLRIHLNDSAQAVFRPEPSKERIKQGRIGSVYWIVGKTIIADFTQHALLVAHHLEYRQTHLPGPGFQTTHDEHLFALRVL